jgi:hypothetical protein
VEIETLGKEENSHVHIDRKVLTVLTRAYIKAHMIFICSILSGASSIRSISLIVMPNSLRRCSGSPYVSQLFALSVKNSEIDRLSDTTLVDGNAITLYGLHVTNQ